MGSENVEHTPDGRYIVVKGRRWRATDPSIPESLRAELVSALMTGRRMVRTHGDAARVMVHDAKVALGERGDPWWEPTGEGQRKRIAATVRTLARARGEEAFASDDVARVVGGEGWREHLGTVDEVVAQLRDQGVVRTGATDTDGPVRIAAAEGLEFQPNLPD
ncbi:DUF3253 domain-containing protein [Corynebacterium sp. YIM 101645]|uniref:DUF3253 domain-containing protein n=1 Tax=Corynebacterium lemuris TaxID=1859292 RepID=A0ABT2FSL9_9CORY|nr:DUF3253 domain-containing protein [Corynebacterium lemuris]MCS5478212.1 DUF3253 domain-containing protein [Corynebacterium lemuris]